MSNENIPEKPQGPEKLPKPEKSQQRSLGAELSVVPEKNAVRVVILQHPQEPDKLLGTAALCVRSLTNAELKIGLSWRSHKAILGENAVPSEWGVLYLGPQGLPPTPPLIALDKKNKPLPELPPLRGIVLLDGTWSQAKALWWRNAWLLKLRRLVLRPPAPSLYGNLRKEPRAECVSTIECAAYALQGLGDRPAATAALLDNFSKMLDLYREEKRTGIKTSK